MQKLSITERLQQRPDVKQFFGRIPFEALTDEHLTGDDTRILGLIAVHCRYMPRFITLDELAKAVKRTTRSVMRSIERLEDRKWVTVKRRHHYPNIYDVPSIPRSAHRTCLKCEMPSYRLNKAGQCVKCQKAANAPYASTPRKAAQSA